MAESIPSTPAERHVTNTTPQKDIVEALISLGRSEHEIKFGGMKFGIRSLSPADEIYIYELAAAEARSTVSRLLLARIYIVCLMLRSIDGVPIEALFKTPEADHRTDDDRYLVCRLLGPVFGQQWDRRAFRYFFRLLWAWSEVQHLDVAAEHGVQAFLTPEELELYRQVKDSEAVTTALDAAEHVDLEEALGQDDPTSGPDALEVGDVE